jgi:hypothetical protein
MNNAKRNAGFVQTTEIRRADLILGDADLQQWMALLYGGERYLPRCCLCEAGDLRGHNKMLGTGLVAQPEVMFARSENAKRIFRRFVQHLISPFGRPVGGLCGSTTRRSRYPGPA